MSSIRFSKYHGTGNDFVIVDNRNRVFDSDNNDLVMHICHRRFGVGADGFMLLESSDKVHLQCVITTVTEGETIV